MKDLLVNDFDVIPFEFVGLLDGLASSTIVSVTDLRGVILSVNKNFCLISGYTESELIGKNHSLVNSGYHTSDFWKGLWKTIASGEFWRGEIRNKRKNGSYYWVDSYIYPIKDDCGSVVKYLSVRHDITEKKEEQQSVLNLKQQLEAIHNSTLAANILVNQDGNILALNNQAKNHPFFFKQGTYLDNALPLSFYHDFQKIIHHTIKEERAIEFEREFINDNCDRYFHVAFTPALDQNECILGVSINITDVTDQTRFQLQLVERNTQLEEIAWQQSHIVRGPVASLLGLINLLQLEWGIKNVQEIIPRIKQVAEDLDSNIKTIVRKTY